MKKLENNGYYSKSTKKVKSYSRLLQNAFYLRVSMGVGLAKIKMLNDGKASVLQEFISRRVASQIIRKIDPSIMGRKVEVKDEDVRNFIKGKVTTIPGVTFLILSGEYDGGNNLEESKILKDNAPEKPADGRLAGFRREHKNTVLGWLRDPIICCTEEAIDTQMKRDFSDKAAYCIQGHFYEIAAHMQFKTSPLSGESGSFFNLSSLFGSNFSVCHTFKSAIIALKVAYGTK